MKNKLTKTEIILLPLHIPAEQRLEMEEQQLQQKPVQCRITQISCHKEISSLALPERDPDWISSN